MSLPQVPALLDTAVPMYAAGAAHRYRDPLVLYQNAPAAGP
jgi:hypothetical protein